MLKRVNHQFLVSIALFLVSLCILLWDSGELFKSDPVAIGFAENNGKELSLRLDGDIAWTKVSGQTKIHSGDRIYTGENSVANLDFFDSFSLQLNELTLVRVSSKMDKPEVEVGQGSFTLNLKNNSQGVVLKIGKKEIKVSGANSSIEVTNKNGDVSVKVNQGSVELVKAEDSGKSMIVSAGESVDVSGEKWVSSKIEDQDIPPPAKPEVKITKKRDEEPKARARIAKRVPSNDLSPMFVEIEKKPADETAEASEGILEKIKHKLFFGIGLGVTSTHYQDALVSVTQYSLTPKIAMSYRFADRIRLVLNSFFTAIPLNENVVKTDPIAHPTLTAPVTIRYLGVNARASYLTPWLHNGWRLELSGGWYYNSTFVTNNYFGYKNISGPQIYPSVEKDFKDASTLGGYIKYSPVSSGLAFLNIFSNYEIALGAYYLFAKSEEARQRWGLSLDYAHLSLLPQGMSINADSVSLGFSLLFL